MLSDFGWNTQLVRAPAGVPLNKAPIGSAPSWLSALVLSFPLLLFFAWGLESDLRSARPALVAVPLAVVPLALALGAPAAGAASLVLGVLGFNAKCWKENG